MQHFTLHPQFKITIIKKKTNHKKPLKHTHAKPKEQDPRIQHQEYFVYLKIPFLQLSVNMVFIMRLSNICCIWEIKEDKDVGKVCVWGGSPVPRTPPSCLTSFNVIRFHYKVHNVILCVEEGYKSKWNDSRFFYGSVNAQCNYFYIPCWKKRVF